MARAVRVLTTTATPTISSTARLEPAALKAPNRSPIEASAAGRPFVHANGADDLVVFFAIDGRTIGTMPAGMNPAAFADWSTDDSWFVRLTVDKRVEVYGP